MGPVTAINGNRACSSIIDHGNGLDHGLCKQPVAAIDLFIF
jgi:hypothetical protein